MKITGTKKLLIILCAIICVFAAGLGVIFTRSATGTVAYAASDGHILPMADGEKVSDATSEADKKALKELSEATGISPELLTFYARSNDGDRKSVV